MNHLDRVDMIHRKRKCIKSRKEPTNQPTDRLKTDRPTPRPAPTDQSTNRQPVNPINLIAVSFSLVSEHLTAQSAKGSTEIYAHRVHYRPQVLRGHSVFFFRCTLATTTYPTHLPWPILLFICRCSSSVTHANRTLSATIQFFVVSTIFKHLL